MKKCFDRLNMKKDISRTKYEKGIESFGEHRNEFEYEVFGFFFYLFWYSFVE